MSFWKKLFGKKPEVPAEPLYTKQDADEDAAPAENKSAAGAAASPEVGYYVAMSALTLPDYIIPGLGFLVLRDFNCQSLFLDGTPIGEEHTEHHPQFRGSFRGFYNVPPGLHTISVTKDTPSGSSLRSTWKLELAPNRAGVQRLDWRSGGFVADAPETERRYQDLALSGSMLQADALRPWPLASLYFLLAPTDLKINGIAIPASVPRKFFGLLNLPPGSYELQYGDKKMRLALQAESSAAIQFEDDGTPAILDPMMSALSARAMLMRSPKESLVRFDELPRGGTESEGSA